MNTHRILIVDDEAVSRKSLKTQLEHLGYLVDTADDGYQAWELLKINPNKFDLVIVDRMMIGIDGMELLRRIKSDEQLKHIPVIMETGQAESEELIAAVKAGAYECIYKPVEENLLMYIVKSALEKDLLERQGSFEDF